MDLSYITCLEHYEYFTFPEAPRDTAFFLNSDERGKYEISKVEGPEYNHPVPASPQEVLSIIEHSPYQLIRYIPQEAYEFLQMLRGIGIKWVARDFDKTVRGYDVKPTRSGRPDSYWYGGVCDASVKLIFTPLGDIVSWKEDPVRTDMFTAFLPKMESYRRKVCESK